MQVFYKPGALRVIKKFSNQEKDIFKKVLLDIIETPQAGGFLKGSLVGLRKWKFRAREVPYRVIYKLESDKIEIVAVGKRKDFYDLLK